MHTNIINKSAVLGAATALSLAALVGCSAPSTDETEPAAGDTSSTTAPPAPVEPSEKPADLSGLTQGDSISVPAVADSWGEGTVWKDVEPDRTHSVVAEFTVPVEELTVSDAPDPLRPSGQCVTVEVPDIDGVSPIRVDAPNGVGDVFEGSADGTSDVAPLTCVMDSGSGSESQDERLDEARNRALEDRALTIRATVQAAQVDGSAVE